MSISKDYGSSSSLEKKEFQRLKASADDEIDCISNSIPEGKKEPKNVERTTTLVSNLIDRLKNIENFDERKIVKEYECEKTFFVDIEYALEAIFDVGFQKINLNDDENNIVSILLEKTSRSLMNYIATGYIKPKQDMLVERSSAEFLFTLLTKSKIEKTRLEYLLDMLKKSIAMRDDHMKDIESYLSSDSDFEES